MAVRQPGTSIGAPFVELIKHRERFLANVPKTAFSFGKLML
jgi:hypothetical protein